MTAKDAFGQEIKDGDYVTYPASFGSSTMLVLAQVESVRNEVREETSSYSRRLVQVPEGYPGSHKRLRVNRRYESWGSSPSLLGREDQDRLVSLSDFSKILKVPMEIAEGHLMAVRQLQEERERLRELERGMRA